jgi:dynein assembly factor 3
MPGIPISVARETQKPQDYASDGTDAIGFIHFWGTSPALDLLGRDPQAAAFGPAAVGVSPGGYYKDQAKAAKDKDKPDEPQEDCDDGEADGDADAPAREDCAEPTVAPLPEGDEPVNVLLMGGADLRHVVKTLAKRRRRVCGDDDAAEGGGLGRLRFFLHENSHEVLARHILFLQIINNKALPARERMETFLSLYGNALVRERDCTYVGDIASEFVELVTDNSEHPLSGIVDLSHLKFKDRDVLQDVFKGWLKDVPFDVEALREQRCRGFYRERFDLRKNIMDLHYHNNIKGSAGIINWYHYKEFCHTGVAFESRLASYNSPNRTVASYTEAVDRSKGNLVQARGFWADIINSPYHAFGTTTDLQDRARLFKVTSQQYRHNETDIAEFNLTAWLNEMDTGRAFHLPPERPEEDIFPYASPLEALQLEASEPKIQEVKEEKGGGAAGKDAGKRAGSRRGARRFAADWPPLLSAFEGVEVVLLTGDIREVLRKSRYKGLFHRAFVGSMSVLPLLEDMGLTKNSKDPFLRAAEGSGRPASSGQIRRTPRVEAPELFATKRNDCALAGAMADGAQVIFETMKYQATFEGQHRLSFRHRLAQVGHLAGWDLADERHAVPRLEGDMLEGRKRDLEKDATDFLRFVTTSAPAEAPHSSEAAATAD